MAYVDQLKKLKDDEKLLLDRKKKIIDTRKAEVGRIAERMNILEISNAVIAGALLQLKNSDKSVLERFENEGERFLRPRTKSSSVEKNRAEN